MKINIDDIKGMQAYLVRKKILSAGENISRMEKPGEGNMNYTLRVITPQRSIIAKQANPFVQKYPQIPAPPQRALSEASFYYSIQESETLSEMMPKILFSDEQNFILGLEDLGVGEDMGLLYKNGETLSAGDLEKLCEYLSDLHKNYALSVANKDELMANRILRRLNHEHIFIYPLLADNGFDLEKVQEGLAALAKPYKENVALKEKAVILGKNYLSDGRFLLHGDFYPGSWMQTESGIKVIDPEFCFYGHAEFDIGVMRAHLMLAEQPPEMIASIDKLYKPIAGYDQKLSLAYTGIEMIRRIIGLAQLPLPLSINEKEVLLRKALELLEVN